MVHGQEDQGRDGDVYHDFIQGLGIFCLQKIKSAAYVADDDHQHNGQDGFIGVHVI